MTFKKFKLNDINPVGFLYFILVVALLIIVTNQGKMNRTLQSDILEVQQQFTSATQKYQEEFTSATQKYQEDLITAKEQLQNSEEELSWQIIALQQDLEVLERKLIEIKQSHASTIRQKNYQLERNSIILSDLESKIVGYESQLKIAQTQLATTTEALTDALENPVCLTTTCPDTQ